MQLTPAPNKAILIRVGVDHSCGKWLSPCVPDNRDFVYVPIPQDNHQNAPGMSREYSNLIVPALQTFSARNHIDVNMPAALHGRRMHLDPDFQCRTYGDTKDRGRRLIGFEENDWIVFYAGLKDASGSSRVIYGLIGLFVVDKVRQVRDIPGSDFDLNAHTRLQIRDDSDIVVTAKPEVSGRFENYIDIGEFRNRSYRVRRDILNQWGGLGVKDGWLQRSANPPLFLKPEQFAAWLHAQDPTLIAQNNI